MNVSELHRFVSVELPLRHAGTRLSLDKYLRSLLAHAERCSQQKCSYALMAQLFDAAFDATIDESKYLQVEVEEAAETDFDQVRQVLLFQIRDLQSMTRAQLEDEQRYFGLQSPAGNSWYNFDPFSFLECGVAGLLAQTGFSPNFYPSKRKKRKSIGRTLLIFLLWAHSTSRRLQPQVIGGSST